MDEYRGQKVLITGGLGFIGSNLAIRLVSAGASVTLVDSFEPHCGANPFNIEPICKDIEAAVRGDVRDLDLMCRLVRGQQFVFSLAGSVSHLESMQDPFNDLQLNCLGPLTVLEACRRANLDVRVIYSGTRQAYGRPQSLPLVETHPLRPIDINGVNKMTGEAYHLVYYHAYGLPAVSLRLVNTFGPRQLVRHSRQGFIGWFIRQAIDGEEIQLYGDGQQLRGFNYIDEVVDALLLAGVRKNVYGDVFNLGGSQPYTLEHFVKILLRITGRGSYRIVPFPCDKRTIDVGSVYTSSAKFANATGWKPSVPLEQALARTVEYYQQYHAHYW
jgi:UDP-glucose 4-epimerase